VAGTASRFEEHAAGHSKTTLRSPDSLHIKWTSQWGLATRALLLVAPGWVRTELGGEDASLSTGESIPLVVDTIDANRGKPGLRYLDRFNKSLPW
jgi:hypothetical protein